MKIFDKDLVLLQQDIASKGHAICKMIDVLYQNGKLSDKDQFTRDVYEREDIMSTGIGRGIAIPHGRSSAANELSCVFMTSKDAINFDSIDDKPVSIIFLIAIPSDVYSEYTKSSARFQSLCTMNFYKMHSSKLRP